jgi:hypothetical protein
MEQITQHELYIPVMFFILGMIGSMAAFGAGLGAFITTKTLTRLANKLYACIRLEEAADIKAPGPDVRKDTAKQKKQTTKKENVSQDNRLQQKNPEQGEIQKICGTCIHRGTGRCDEGCPYHPKYVYMPIRQNKDVSQHSARSQAQEAKNEIQEPNENAYMGGDSDCYTYCPTYTKYGRCYEECPIAQEQTALAAEQ